MRRAVIKMTSRRDFLKLSISGLVATVFPSSLQARGPVDSVQFISMNGFVFPDEEFLREHAGSYGLEAPADFIEEIRLAISFSNRGQYEVSKGDELDLPRENFAEAIVLPEGFRCGAHSTSRVYSAREIAAIAREENIPYGKIEIRDERGIGEVYSVIKEDDRDNLDTSLEQRFPNRREGARNAAQKSAQVEFNSHCR
jgi:hypothetical protein